MPGRQAGSGVGLHIAKSPKQGSKRFISITNTLLFAQLVILFFYGHCCHPAAKVLYLDVLVLVPDVLGYELNSLEGQLHLRAAGQTGPSSHHPSFRYFVQFFIITKNTVCTSYRIAHRLLSIIIVNFSLFFLHHCLSNFRCIFQVFFKHRTNISKFADPYRGSVADPDIPDPY